MMPEQRQLTFFQPDDPPPLVLRQLEVEQKLLSPFAPYRKAITPLAEAAVDALGRYNHACKRGFAIHGPVTLFQQVAQAFATLLELPFCPIRGLLVEQTNDLLVSMAKVCEDTVVQSLDGPVSLELQFLGQRCQPGQFAMDYMRIPPLVLYVDELNDLPVTVLRRLLQATNDDMMLCDGTYLAHCDFVCWLFRSQDLELLERLGDRFVLLDLSKENT